MKVSLIVVQGKPEGKVIPLALPRFRIGRGEECHLRPNNEQISRLHSEIVVEADRVIVRDLGSRNGTFVNNKRLGPDDFVLSNKDLIQVGPLTFAVSIQGAPVDSAQAAPLAPTRAASLDDISGDQIDSWLVGDQEKPVPERPSGIYTGDTMTFGAYKAEGAKSDPNAKKLEPAPTKVDKPAPPAAAAAEVREVPKDEAETIYDKLDDEDQLEDLTDPTEIEGGDEAPSDEDFLDENNPFAMAKKKVAAEAAAGGLRGETAKQSFKDSSTAAEEMLRKMMERRKATR